MIGDHFEGGVRRALGHDRYQLLQLGEGRVHRVPNTIDVVHLLVDHDAVFVEIRLDLEEVPLRNPHIPIHSRHESGRFRQLVGGLRRLSFVQLNRRRLPRLDLSRIRLLRLDPPRLRLLRIEQLLLRLPRRFLHPNGVRVRARRVLLRTRRLLPGARFRGDGARRAHGELALRHVAHVLVSHPGLEPLVHFELQGVLRA